MREPRLGSRLVHRIPGERRCRDLQPAGLGAPSQSVLQSSARVLVPCLLGVGVYGSGGLAWGSWGLADP